MYKYSLNNIHLLALCVKLLEVLLAVQHFEYLRWCAPPVIYFYFYKDNYRLLLFSYWCNATVSQWIAPFLVNFLVLFCFQSWKTQLCILFCKHTVARVMFTVARVKHCFRAVAHGGYCKQAAVTPQTQISKIKSGIWLCAGNSTVIHRPQKMEKHHESLYTEYESQDHF